MISRPVPVQDTSSEQRLEGLTNWNMRIAQLSTPLRQSRVNIEVLDDGQFHFAEARTVPKQIELEFTKHRHLPIAEEIIREPVRPRQHRTSQMMRSLPEVSPRQVSHKYS